MKPNFKVRKYKRSESIVFRKTNESFGGLSNMAPGFPLVINGIKILTSEALYQACRFPHLPEVQKLIVDQKSPMTAKMKSKPYRARTRPNWDNDRILIMRWCLRVKLLQNWDKFHPLLLATNNLPIVEESKKDDFWGAKPIDTDLLFGVNALGRLFMELREEFKDISEGKLTLNPPNLNDFVFLNSAIPKITVDIKKNEALSKINKKEIENPHYQYTLDNFFR